MTAKPDEMRELERAREKAKLAQDFRAVFGNPKGQAVLKHLKRQFRFEAPVFFPTAHGYCDTTAKLTDGARSVIFFIEQTMRPEEDAKPKAPVKKD